MASPGKQPGRASQPPSAATRNPSDPDMADSVFSQDVSGDESDAASQADSNGSSGPRDLVKSEFANEQEGAVSESLPMPVQKRRRVTRACDECRRKKIKCDGKQPCTHCSVYSYECTYDKPSNRRRNPAPQYIEALENKLQRAETLLRKYMPDVDLSDPDLDPAVQQEFVNRERARAQAAKLEKAAAPVETENQDAQIVSMIETIGQLDLSEGGEIDFHGISSGAVFLRRMKEHLPGLLGTDSGYPFLPRPPRPPGMLNLDSPQATGSPPFDQTLHNVYELPPKEHALLLCHFAINCATCLVRIVHAPTFYAGVDRIYEKTPDSFTTEDNRTLALLYAVMAVGSMYRTTDEKAPAAPVHYKAAMEEGLKYYSSARILLQDITECRDVVSLQALLFVILFLQATSNLSACYSFVGIALRSALRMGLHRHLPHANFTPIEHETRRRVFHVVRQIDTYVSALLGFPFLLRAEDVDQPLPTEVDDEYITEDGILQPPSDAAGSFLEAFNAHARLMTILQEVVRHVYPLKGIEQCVMRGDRPNATYCIPYGRIKEIEAELQEWYEQLPARWRPSAEGPIEVVRVRTLLRFAYAHVQMLLYRPFLHYISPRLSVGKTVDDRYYACAAAGISVSRNIVHIGVEIKKQAVLVGPYWFMLYTEFFAIISLVFYALENPDKPGSIEILAEAAAGKDVINTLAQRSLTADRVAAALNALFQQLPDQAKKGKSRAIATKKRSAPPARTASLPSHPPHQVLSGTIASRRSDELHRPSTGSSSTHDHMRTASRGMSFDSISGAPSMRQNPAFVSGYADMVPLDLASTAASSESGGTPTTSHRTVAGSLQQGTPGSSSSANPFYKVDAVMFPSGDPFAYPNQPMMEFNPLSQLEAPHLQGGGGQQGANQYYMPNLYDDIEGQLVGPLPPYLVHPGQVGLDLSAQVYDTSSMLAMQQVQQQQQQQQQPPQQQPQLHHDQSQQEYDDMMAGHGGWGGVLPQHNNYRRN